MVASAIALAVTMAVTSAPPAKKTVRWFDRPSCLKVMEMVMSGEFTEADRRLKELGSRHDIEDRACAIWVRLAMAEAQISVGGRMPALLKNRKKALLKMFSFGKQHRNYSPHIADLAIEARMKRVRVLLEEGERSAALKESKIVKQKLARRTAAKTPTFYYVSGITNMAVSQESWPIRMLLRMAGQTGDADEGRRALKRLYEGTTVYRFDALYVMRHFARSNPSTENGRPIVYSKQMNTRFPTNPQLLFDYANDLWSEKRCADSVKVMQSAMTKLASNPNLWSNQVRAKLFWLSGRCAMDLGDKGKARKYLALAEQQKFEGMSEEISELREDL